MRLRAEITIDIQAKDFVDAADHQRRLEELFQLIQREYSGANLLLRERREKTGVALRPEGGEGPRRSLPPRRRI
jgi:hypothetical protein